MEEKLRLLYKKVILRHNDDPVSFEKKEEAQYQIEAYNPLCGDQFTVYLNLENSRVTDIWFYGYGCAISKASTSVLVKKLLGRSSSEILDIIQSFYEIVSPGKDQPENPAGIIQDEEMEAFGGARHFPARRKCATLSWDSIREFILKQETA